MSKPTDRLERFRMALSNSGYPEVGARTYADEDGDPILPWFDGEYPQSIEEVHAVRRAYNIVYVSVGNLDEQWAVAQFEAWTPRQDTWWLVKFNVIEHLGTEPVFKGGILVEAEVGPLALKRVMALGFRQVGRASVSGPIPAAEIPTDWPRDTWLTPAMLGMLPALG